MTDSLNLTNLRDMTDGDTEMEKELFQVFIESSEEAIASLKTNIADVDAWKKNAHALKGISLSLGAEKLSELATTAQDDFDKDKIFKTNLLHQIEQEYAVVKKLLLDLNS